MRLNVSLLLGILGYKIKSRTNVLHKTPVQSSPRWNSNSKSASIGVDTYRSFACIFTGINMQERWSSKHKTNFFSWSRIRYPDKEMRKTFDIL